MDSTISLPQDVMQDVASLMDNNYAMKRLRAFLKKLKKEESNVMTAKDEKEILQGIKEGLREVKLAREGKIQLRPARELLDELRG